MIIQKGKKCQLWSKDGKKLLGTYDTRNEALAAERRARFYKSKKRGD